MARLELRGVSKRFSPAAAAVDNVTLEVRDGEFLTLLGPSGCGKTTTLRIIAGLVDPDEGAVLLDGQPIHHLPAHSRETAMVFQSYALFPHMTVRDNIAFGLRMRGVPFPAIKERVQDALVMVELEGMGDRYPRQLSGGQQQRVAVARAVVTQPKVLLFDEPLSNLDAKLRERLRLELRALQQRLGVTTVYVTHDQAEALALSDRVAVMFRGRVVEIGTPREVYRTPHSRLSAEFLGVANLLEGRVTSVDSGRCSVETRLGSLSVDAVSPVRPGEAVTLSFRPEDIQIRSPQATPITGRIVQAAYLGSTVDYVVESQGIMLRVHEAGSSAHDLNEPVSLVLPQVAAIIRED
jgi:spermidine/putrescine ABC transporter ATP-binding subunit